MQHKTYHMFFCCILLVTAACAPRSTPTPAPTVPPPTATTLPPTETGVLPAPTLVTVTPEVIAQVDALLSNLADKAYLSASVLIGHRGTVLLSKGYGLADKELKVPNTGTTRFRLASITKQFTAAAILLLEERGKLKVSDPICSYLADCPSAWKDITIHHLLTHTSGIRSYYDLDGIWTAMDTPASPQQVIARFRDLPLDFQPGEQWSYSDSGYALLGYIIEQVSGQTYEQFLHDAIFTPLNLGNTGYEPNANGLALGYQNHYGTPADTIDMSNAYAGGALYSSVEDLYTWVNALSTQKLLSQASLDQMFAPQAAVTGGDGSSYGYGWFIGTDFNRSVVLHPGGLPGVRTIVVRYVDDQIVIIVLSNQEETDVMQIENLIAKKLFGVQ